MKPKPFVPRLAAALLALLLAAALALPAAAVTAPGDAPAVEAQDLTGEAVLTISGGYAPGTFTDQNRGTYQALPAETTIEVSSAAPFTHIYVVWDAPPAPWQLEVNGEAATRGRGGYLHEAITLEAPATEAALILGGSEYTLCDLYLFGEGVLPAWVQQWQPTLEKADLLALPTHADDEHLFFGGILPTYAGERGLAVQVVYMTNHWGERYRPHELLDGLWEVGVTAYPVMGPFSDLYASKESLAAAESTFGREAVLGFQVETLRRFKPHVVVGHDLNGEYGHGAHMLNAATLLEALPLAADETAFPESAAQYGAWEVPKAYLHLYAENQIVMDWDIPLAAFGGKTGYEMAVAGFAKHVSQTGYFAVTQGGTWEDCRKFGLAHTAVGPDVAGDDLFENIDLTPDPPPPPPDPEPPVSSLPASVPQGSSSVSPPASVSASQQPADGSPWLLPVLLGGAGLLAVIAVVIVAAVRAQRRKRRRRGHHWRPRQ